MSELEQLSGKITQLSEAARSLKNENAALRRHLRLLQDEHDTLARRSHEAQRRIKLLLEKFPQIVIEAEDV